MVYNLSYAQEPNERPKLIVGVVVDQMRNEYIQRYYDDFGENGFKRLIREGFYFSNTHYNYFPTYTAPGHASIYTGTTPSVHGIVGNWWFHKQENKDVYCTADDNCPLVGAEGRGMSGERLMTTTLGDELKMFTNQRGKVIGVSIKDRGAILPAGHMGDAAYWFNDDGNFITSTYYMEKLPSWVTSFNDKKLAIDYIKKGWNVLRENSYDESDKDNSPYESRLGGSDPVFPYDLTNLIKMGGVGAIRSTPYGNDIVVDFALEAIAEEELGKDDIIDLLAISFSATDYVGHAMGPRAIETQDTYLRLDQSLARLLEYLDNKVGGEDYVLFLSSDHGAGEVPNFLKDHNIKAEALSDADFRNDLKTFSIEKYGENVVKNFSNNNIYFNDIVLNNLKLNLTNVQAEIANYVLTKPSVKRVYTSQQILQGNAHEYYLQMIAAGYDVKQNGELVLLLEPGYMFYKSTGTTHGSPYAYDTHVPLIYYGWGIQPGRSHAYHSITEIAPTISQLTNIPLPSGSTGKVMLEVLDK